MGLYSELGKNLIENFKISSEEMVEMEKKAFSTMQKLSMNSQGSVGMMRGACCRRAR